MSMKVQGAAAPAEAEITYSPQLGTAGRNEGDGQAQEAESAFDTPAAEYERSPQARLAQENRKTFSGGEANIFDRMKTSSSSSKKTVYGTSTKYDATGDLMSIANAENPAILKTIQIRLMYKVRMLSGITSGDGVSEAESSKRKVKRVIAKVKAKIKNLKKEEQIERKAKSAQRSKMQRLEMELKKELAIKKRNRKGKEKMDVDDSRKGMGCNYDGVLAGDSSAEMRAIEAEIASLNMAKAAAAESSSGGSSSSTGGTAAAGGDPFEGSAAAQSGVDVGAISSGFSAIC